MLYLSFLADDLPMTTSWISETSLKSEENLLWVFGKGWYRVVGHGCQYVLGRRTYEALLLSKSNTRTRQCLVVVECYKYVWRLCISELCSLQKLKQRGTRCVNKEIIEGKNIRKIVFILIIETSDINNQWRSCNVNFIIHFPGVVWSKCSCQTFTAFCPRSPTTLSINFQKFQFCPFKQFSS